MTRVAVIVAAAIIVYLGFASWSSAAEHRRRAAELVNVADSARVRADALSIEVNILQRRAELRDSLEEVAAAVAAERARELEEERDRAREVAALSVARADSLVALLDGEDLAAVTPVVEAYREALGGMEDALRAAEEELDIERVRRQGAEESAGLWRATATALGGERDALVEERDALRAAIAALEDARDPFGVRIRVPGAAAIAGFLVGLAVSR